MSGEYKNQSLMCNMFSSEVLTDRQTGDVERVGEVDVSDVIEHSTSIQSTVVLRHTGQSQYKPRLLVVINIINDLITSCSGCSGPSRRRHQETFMLEPDDRRRRHSVSWTTKTNCAARLPDHVLTTLHLTQTCKPRSFCQQSKNVTTLHAFTR